jgi:hypothetical protein
VTGSVRLPCCRVHRIPRSTFVTTAKRPSLRNAGRPRLVEVICPTAQGKVFGAGAGPVRPIGTTGKSRECAESCQVTSKCSIPSLPAINAMTFLSLDKGCRRGLIPPPLRGESTRVKRASGWGYRKRPPPWPALRFGLPSPRFAGEGSRASLCHQSDSAVAGGVRYYRRTNNQKQRFNWWSNSTIRIPSRQPLLRMLELRTTSKHKIVVEFWI